jgi:hypothetical protein
VTWLAFFFALQLGYQPNPAFFSYAPPAFVVNQQLYQDFKAGFTFAEHLNFGGEIVVYDWFDSKRSDNFPWMEFFTNRLDSWVFVNVTFPGVEIGAKYVCSHPIDPLNATLSRAWDGSSTEFYVKFSGSIPLIKS